MKPCRAAVRPRFISPSTGDALTLEDSVEAVFRHFHHGVVEIAGPKGAGKTAALQHLAAVLPEELRVHFLSYQNPETSTVQDCSAIVEVSPEADPLPNRIARFHLAPWSVDDCIEYTLSRHRPHADSVIQRLLKIPDQYLLAGCPELCAVVLDRMANNPAIDTVTKALREQLLELTASDSANLPAPMLLLMPIRSLPYSRKKLPLPIELSRLLNHAAVRITAIAMQLAEELNTKGDFRLFQETAPLLQESDNRRRIVIMISELVDTFGRQQLTYGLRKKWLSKIHSTLASVLVRVDNSWRPGPGNRPDLNRALLQRVDWPRIDLRRYQLAKADLSKANLSGALLRKTAAHSTRFSGATLTEARMSRINAVCASFRNSKLEKVSATDATMTNADFSNAVARDAVFEKADLMLANFTEADLRRADLKGANLDLAVMTETDLTGADLTATTMQRVDLRTATFDGAVFRLANLTAANLEDVVLDAVEFAKCTFSNALLTGAAITNSVFINAKFSGAYLAEVNLSGSDLRNADFQGATFHMGSSRSGLVSSDIASEGTRTGFYSTDYDEHSYRNPEEIRVANLCDCDLRGARVKGVDFWRVDLRGATYDAEQREQFVATGAILE